MLQTKIGMIFKILEVISLGVFFGLYLVFFVSLGGEKIVSLVCRWIEGLSLS